MVKLYTGSKDLHLVVVFIIRVWKYSSDFGETKQDKQKHLYISQIYNRFVYTLFVLTPSS